MGLIVVVEVGGGISNSFRTGSGCRIKVHRLKQEFSTPDEAEAHLLAQIKDIENRPVQTGFQVRSSNLSMSDAENSLCQMLTHWCAIKGISVPENFNSFFLRAMEYLHENGHSDLFYNLAKGFGTMRHDGSDSRFPVRRMPFGLLDYMARFFSCDNYQQVTVLIQ